MGYEEVETVLPADFVPQPDPVSEQPAAISKPQSPKAKATSPMASPRASPKASPKAASVTNDDEFLMSESEPESEAEDAGCSGRRKKKKKRRSSSSRSGRKSIMNRWRSSRSKSRSRKKKEDESSTASSSKDGSKKSSKSKSKSSRLSFRTIKKVDSNATEIASNTTKAKEEEESGEEQRQSANADENKEVSAINNGASAALPTVREGSPANTASITAEGDGGDEGLTLQVVPATEGGLSNIASPSPAPTVNTHATELSIEIGDENEGFELQVDPSFHISKEEEEEETPAPESAAEEVLAIEDAAAAAQKETAILPVAPAAIIPAITAAPSKDQSESVEKAAATAAAPPVQDDLAAATSTDNADAASVRSSKSTKSTKSNKSTSSKRSLRSLGRKRSNKSTTEEDTATAKAVPDEAEAAKEKTATEDAAAAAAEDDTSDKENAGGEAAANTDDTANNTKTGKKSWTKKVSLSIGGYKTSFQFSDPMANLADAVNDALNVGDDTVLASQAKELDETSPADMDGVDAEEQVRDYDDDPTRLFMYLQQRAWGLALIQLQNKPEEARVWVYRKAKPEKAPDVDDASQKKGAIVVAHNSMVPHDDTKFRWKLLPLHAAIVLGAPTEIIQDVIRAYPHAAKKTDERGSLPVHLAASRLDVDPEGEKVVLQLFGAYPDSIEMQDRKGRTPPELAKLARARKEIEEVRKAAASVCPSQMGVEQTTGELAEEVAGDRGEEAGGEEDGSSQGSGDAAGEGDDDDDASVKSGISGRFRMMLRKSKSTDTVDRRKKKNKGKKKKGSSISKLGMLGLNPAKSMDDNDDDAVDDATVAESLGPGFAFVKTSEAQELRERTASDEEDVQVVECEQTEEEILRAAKKKLIGQEYQIMTEAAPRDAYNVASIPLPMSFSMNDDASVRSSRSGKSSRSSRSSRSTKSSKSTRSTKISKSTKSAKSKVEEEQPESSPEVAAPIDTPTDTPSEVVDEKSAVSAVTTGAKSVTISSEEPQVQEIANEVEDDNDSDQTPPEPVNEGLRQLLEKATENAGRPGIDVTEFVRTLEDEWVTDVEALRRLDGETLDELLPLMLSRELQRLINHADSIDNKFLKEDRQALGTVNSRGRSPNKKAKKKKKKRSHRRVKKRNSYRPVTPTDGSLDPITEEADSPGSTGSDNLSIVTDVRSVYSAARTVAPQPPSLPGVDDEEEADSNDEPAVDTKEEDTASDGEQGDDDEDSNEDDEEVDIAQSASIEDLEIRKLHANLIADARKKFPTREALENSIRERQAEVEAAVNSGFDVDKETLARAALADDEVRKLLPLRLILPTVTDLNEMISVLQMHKEGAIRELDMETAKNIQGEIDELQEQIDLEERYLLKKRMGETKCTDCDNMFPTVRKMKGVLKTKQKKCEGCREDEDSTGNKSTVRVDVETVDSGDDN